MSSNRRPFETSGTPCTPSAPPPYDEADMENGYEQLTECKAAPRPNSRYSLFCCRKRIEKISPENAELLRNELTAVIDDFKKEQIENLLATRRRIILAWNIVGSVASVVASGGVMYGAVKIFGKIMSGVAAMTEPYRMAANDFFKQMTHGGCPAVFDYSSTTLQCTFVMDDVNDGKCQDSHDHMKAMKKCEYWDQYLGDCKDFTVRHIPCTTYIFDRLENDCNQLLIPYRGNCSIVHDKKNSAEAAGYGYGFAGTAVVFLSLGVLATGIYKLYKFNQRAANENVQKDAADDVPFHQFAASRAVAKLKDFEFDSKFSSIIQYFSKTPMTVKEVLNKLQKIAEQNRVYQYRR